MELSLPADLDALEVVQDETASSSLVVPPSSDSLSPLPLLSDEVLLLMDSQVDEGFGTESGAFVSTSNLPSTSQDSSSSNQKPHCCEALKREIVEAVERAVKRQLDDFKQDLLAMLTPSANIQPSPKRGGLPLVIDTPTSLPHLEDCSSSDTDRGGGEGGLRRRLRSASQSNKKKAKMTVVISSDEEEKGKRDEEEQSVEDEGDRLSRNNESSVGGDDEEVYGAGEGGYDTSDFVVDDDDDPFQPSISGGSRKQRRKNKQAMTAEERKMTLRSRSGATPRSADSGKVYTCEVCGSCFTEALRFYNHKKIHARSFTRS